MLDKHLSWKELINIIENKLSKNVGLLHKAKQFLNAFINFFFHLFIAI